jgi:hypothetical protein
VKTLDSETQFGFRLLNAFFVGLHYSRRKTGLSATVMHSNLFTRFSLSINNNMERTRFGRFSAFLFRQISRLQQFFNSKPFSNFVFLYLYTMRPSLGKFDVAKSLSKPQKKLSSFALKLSKAEDGFRCGPFINGG